MKRMLLLSTLLLSLLSLAANAEDSKQDIEQDAIDVLKKFSTTLAKAQKLSYTMVSGYDVVQDDGQKIEFGGSREISAQKPDKLAVDFKTRQGRSGKILLDSKNIYVYDKHENVYVSTEQVGDISESIDYLSTELKFPFPMKELFSDNIVEALIASVKYAYVIGEADLFGIKTIQLAVQGESIDYQLWISKAEPALLHRVVITYREEKGQPQFWANFTDWKFNDSTKVNYSLDIPKNAERIVILVDDEYLSDEEIAAGGSALEN